MAVRKMKFAVNEADYYTGMIIPTLYHVDTYAERPMSGLEAGDLLFAADNGRMYRATDATTWATLTTVNAATGLMDQPIQLENRTDDPASPVAGQMWFRSDL